MSVILNNIILSGAVHMNSINLNSNFECKVNANKASLVWPASSAFDFSKDYFIEIWFRITALPTQEWNDYWVNPNYDGSANNFDFSFRSYNNQLTPVIQTGVANTTYRLIASAGATVNSTTWQHFATGRKNGVGYLFVNGNLMATGNMNNNFIRPSQYGFGIGAGGNGLYNNFPITTSLFAIHNTCRFTSNFKPTYPRVDTSTKFLVDYSRMSLTDGDLIGGLKPSIISGMTLISGGRSGLPYYVG